MSLEMSVIGAGSWGTAIAQVQAKAGHTVKLWDWKSEHVENIGKSRINQKYHPEIRLSENIHPESNLHKAIEKSRIIFLSTPSHSVRHILMSITKKAPPDAIYVCTSKGFELESLKPLSLVADEVLGTQKASKYFSSLSGPSFAKEVIRQLPTAVTVASHNHETSDFVQKHCHTEHFQIFTSDDLVGVEIAGALKNVFAIAAGASDSLNFGLNARAALITRALAEMSRIGREMGANPLTFAGLSGLGDLLLTATGDLSRNRQVGLKLTEGKSLRQIMKEVGQVAEGIRTTKAAFKLANSLKVDVPILEQMYFALYEKKDPRHALADILSVTPGAERD